MINIVAFCCNWCSYAGADLAGTTRLEYPPEVKIIRVPCSCRVDEQAVLRAFARGADGVIVCGCHPGDCHYSTGNVHTQQHMHTLFGLLEFMGMERQRMRLEWISAAEGAKFAATMREFVAQVAALGKNTRYGATLDSAYDNTHAIKLNSATIKEANHAVHEQILPHMRARAEEKLTSGAVARVLAWGSGAFDPSPAPMLFTDTKTLARMAYNPFCAANHSKYLIEASRESGRTLVFLRPCDAHNFARLVTENQIRRDAVCAVGIACGGCLLETCHTCAKIDHPMVDETIDIALTDRTAANPDARFADIEHLDGETPDARYAFWQAHLTRCIRCNACRNACPTCHCKTCIRDGSHPMEHLHFHITRAFHQAGRCTDCGQCGRVCPQRIPLHLLNRKHIQITEEEAAT